LLLLFFCLIVNGQQVYDMNPNLPKLYNDNEDGFIVIAHRGASAYYPENTMAAFRGAVEMNAEMIEIDIMLSKEGVPVVFHDATLNDHTDGEGRLDEFTVQELKKLDAGSWFDPEFAGQRILTLEEVLEFAAGKIALNIEIKTEAVSQDAEGGVEEKSLELVKEYKMEEYVMFSSFDYRAVRRLKEMDSEISAALLFEKNQSENKLPSELITKYRADAFNCSYQQLSKKRFRDLVSYKIPIFVYTVDQERRMRKLIKKGVSGVFTNKPDLLIETLKNIKRE